MHRTWIVLLLFTSFFAHGSSFVHLNGSGASFPEPIYQKWFKDFSYRDNDARINYQAVGSGDGISQFINGDVDFAGSDLAMSDEQLSYLEKGAVMVPLVAGQVSLIYNLSSVSDLKLSRDVYARIFLGEIQYWDHPDIQASNPGIQLPVMPITVVVRSDASGSSFLFSNHLALVSESFRDNVGASKLPEWSDQPHFLSALHNQGVTAFVRQTEGAIGYVEWGYAKLTRSPTALLENRDGKFVRAGAESGKAALSNVTFPKSNLLQSDVPDLRSWEFDPAGERSYPLASFTWLIFPKKMPAGQSEVVRRLVEYCLTDGQPLAERMGYIPLPENVVALVRNAVQFIE